MSVRSVQTSSSALNQAYSSSLLPFLYHTRTLFAPVSQAHRFNLLYEKRKTYRTISSSARTQARAKGNPNGGKSVFEDHVFANHYSGKPGPAFPSQGVDEQFDLLRRKQTTMTASEKAIFDRIIKDMKQSSAGENAEEDMIEDEENLDVDPFEDLTKIFDTAIQRLKSREEGMESDVKLGKKRLVQEGIDDGQEAKAAQASSSASFIQPIRLDNGVVLGADMDLEENEQELRKACEDHKGLVMGMLERAETDVQIWEILEKEVFSLVKQLDVQIKWEEKARKAHEKRERKAEKEKEKKLDGEQAQSPRVMTDRPKRPKIYRLTKPKPIALPTTTLFSIVRTNYANYLLSALRLLRQYHPTSMYPYTLLPTIRSHGPISYVLGASTPMYNELIFLKWTQFSDLHSMADLMQEMIDQGIEMNEVTWVFIRRLWSKRRYGRMGKFGEVVRCWWNMRGTVEGWKRLWGIYEDVRREEKERSEREALSVATDAEGEREAEEQE